MSIRPRHHGLMEAPTFCQSYLSRYHSAPLSMRRKSAGLSSLSLGNVHLFGQESTLVGPLRSVIHGLWSVSRRSVKHGLGMLRGEGHRLWSLCRWCRGRVGRLALASTCLLLALGTHHCAARVVGQIFLVIMNTLHMVEQIVPSREPIARSAAFTARIVAQVWPFAVSVHAVCFSFMPQ